MIACAHRTSATAKKGFMCMFFGHHCEFRFFNVRNCPIL